MSSRVTMKGCADLIRHPRCTIFTHATVTAINADHAGRSATSIRIRSLGGRSAMIHADTFVLAAGGIENPRLLLADATQFLGMRAYSRIKHGLDTLCGARMLWLYAKKAAMIAQKVSDPARPWLLQKLGRSAMALVIRAEQAPDPAIRVILDIECDALGMPRVRLDWRLNDREGSMLAGLIAEIARGSGHRCDKAASAVYIEQFAELWSPRPCCAAIAFYPAS